MSTAKNPDVFLQPPGSSSSQFSTQPRVHSSYASLHTFSLKKGEEKHYQQQYADMYFLRLAELKPAVEQIAREEWRGFELAGEKAKRVERVLDVRQGELCWVVGTVYMEMPLKPNVLDDISKEHWIAAPPAREKYVSPNGNDPIMLEDESGRLRLTGALLRTELVVTGCIIAALGTENADGVFEVIATRVADLPKQPERWTKSKASKEQKKSGKVAIVSGLSISGESGDMLLHDLLTEYLLGEALDAEQEETPLISRLIIAGDSLSGGSPIPSREELALLKKGQKKYGYDSSSYNSAPTDRLDTFLAQLLPSIPITLLPGESDPANVAIPQQPLHAALFPHSRAYTNPPGQSTASPGWFDSVTNPWEGEIDGWRFLGTGGQPVNDMYKYVIGEDRLEMMEHLLRWRCNAPTAPDTLWSYPFQEDDPFVIHDCPHVYFAGNQPGFATSVIEGPTGQQVRLIAIPKFAATGEIVLLDTETLEAEVVKINVISED